MKILLADDSVTAQNMGKKILSEAGHEVVCVSNGAAALKKISEQEPDLVILDIYMPGYSGLEVCQRLKEGPATASLPVVLTVGKLEPFRKEDAQRVRAEALIVKPFEASELAAAVGRFWEIAAANPPKGKSRGKLGPPQTKPKPQWDEPSPDEFVTTTQKLEEEGYTPGSAKTALAAKQMEGEAEPQPTAAAGEFEVAPAPEGPEIPRAAQDASGASEGLGRVGARITESPAPASGPAEFGVHAGTEVAAQEQASPKAAAAAAGANFGGSTEMSEYPVGSSSPQGFEVTAPSDATAPEPAAFSPQVAADAPNFPAVPEMSATAVLEFSTADPYAGPGVDPAFSADRTQWATDFPTRFGIAEPAEPAAEQVEPPAEAKPEPEAASAPTDEIAAILSSFPGSSFSTEPPSQSAEGVQFGQRPWPVEPSGPEREAWKAEEVPVEDHDGSISLAEEMEKASAARDVESGSQPGFAQAEPPARPEEPAARIVEGQEEPGEPVPADTVEFTQSDPAEETMEAAAPPTVEEPQSSPLVSEIKTGPAAPDQIAGVMQSAAMAIATRATV
ncbi:MAG TPA: response regulator, partial [Terriglobales bacterium]|nr:response regulator [Terriglobales bacterium]